MKVGFDLDGVLCSFNRAFAELLIKTSGRNLLDSIDIDHPSTWDWDLDAGYTREETRRTWNHIVHSDDFWRRLLPLEGLHALDPLIPALEDWHDVYYITSRDGRNVKHQSEQWLRSMLGYSRSQYSPTVIIAKDKGSIAAGLKLDVMVDDKWDNAMSVALARPKCRVYLLDEPYNQPPNDLTLETLNMIQASRRILRVPSVQAVIDAELTNIYR